MNCKSKCELSNEGFTFKHVNRSGITKTFLIPGTEWSLSSLLEEFKYFLQACSFQVEGEVENVVEGRIFTLEDTVITPPPHLKITPDVGAIKAAFAEAVNDVVVRDESTTEVFERFLDRITLKEI